MRQVCGFLQVLWFPLPIKLTAKIINANNMNSYKTLYIILMNISTMLKILLQVCSTTEYQPQKL
jgi:hypothetical protein